MPRFSSNFLIIILIFICIIFVCGSIYLYESDILGNDSDESITIYKMAMKLLFS